MRKRSTARFANGLLSAAIVVLFLAHGTLGSVSAVSGFSGSLSWLVWCGVGLVAVHVAMSGVTSKEQLTDAERPPSVRKKRHLALKWATGGALALAAAFHIVAMRLYGADALRETGFGALVIVLVSVALAVHLCVGSKSLLKDLEIDRRHKTAFRVVVCAFAAFFVLVAVGGFIRW